MYFCLRFVSTIKELSNKPIGLRDNVNQEALSTVKTLMSGPPEQTGGPSPPFVAHPKKFIQAPFSSAHENQSDLIYYTGKHDLHMWHAGLSEG